MSSDDEYSEDSASASESGSEYSSSSGQSIGRSSSDNIFDEVKPKKDVSPKANKLDTLTSRVQKKITRLSKMIPESDSEYDELDDIQKKFNRIVKSDSNSETDAQKEEKVRKILDRLEHLESDNTTYTDDYEMLDYSMNRPIYGDQEDVCERPMGKLRLYVQKQLKSHTNNEFVLEPGQERQDKIKLPKGDVILWFWTSSHQSFLNFELSFNIKDSEESKRISLVPYTSLIWTRFGVYRPMEEEVTLSFIWDNKLSVVKKKFISFKYMIYKNGEHESLYAHYTDEVRRIKQMRYNTLSPVNVEGGILYGFVENYQIYETHTTFPVRMEWEGVNRAHITWVVNLPYDEWIDMFDKIEKKYPKVASLLPYRPETTVFMSTTGRLERKRVLNVLLQSMFSYPVLVDSLILNQYLKYRDQVRQELNKMASKRKLVRMQESERDENLITPPHYDDPLSYLISY